MEPVDARREALRRLWSHAARDVVIRHPDPGADQAIREMEIETAMVLEPSPILDC